jgi:hypothetical protein
MKYSFKQRDMHNLKKCKRLMNEDVKKWKGGVTESLAKCYIRDVLTPRLKEEGWFKVIFLKNIPLYLLMEAIPVYGQNYLSLSSEFARRSPNELTINQRNFLRDKFGTIKSRFEEKNVRPCQELLDSFEKLCVLLNHTPDGFLVKTNKIGTETIAEGRRKIPVVDGEIEVIEVKADKAKMNRAQKDQYSILAKNGYPLRLFHVSIVSIDDNNFEVKEKLLTTVEEIERGAKSLS